MKSICVYCGANAGVSPRYADQARALAAALVEQNLALVYGGGNVGLMGVIADEVLRLGGEVTGVIPAALVEREVGHSGLTRQFIRSATRLARVRPQPRGLRISAPSRRRSSCVRMASARRISKRTCAPWSNRGSTS